MLKPPIPPLSSSPPKILSKEIIRFDRIVQLFGYQNTTISATVDKQIVNEVKACAVSWRRIPKTTENIRLCMGWGIPEIVFGPA
ncbi:hypothetical protein RHMOL_Rhmol04G0330700 [Rhododendron molle]|uniref:Uncharacterized protein n=1 Tax=Rhododendron molle TaxID=49168 RepID=A0ACC0P846_RHOML|nr:hypothetical protein RHMOL_Rhmol04G0330700 [Rhododendron molle]